MGKIRQKRVGLRLRYFVMVLSKKISFGTNPQVVYYSNSLCLEHLGRFKSKKVLISHFTAKDKLFLDFVSL